MIETQQNNNVVESLEDSNDPGYVDTTCQVFVFLSSLLVAVEVSVLCGEYTCI